MWRWVICAAALVLAGCGDGYPDYRYKMTVEVETPDGLKTGSSVIEVRTKEVSTIQDSSGKTFRDQLRGEAVAVDIAPGRTLFALLSSPDNPDYAKGVAFAALKPVRTTGGDLEGYRQHLSQMVKVKGAHDLPRERWPLMVAFRDINDPTSVFEVKAASVADAFGSGTYVKRITIEITDDDVTNLIRDRFPWRDSYLERHFDGTSTVLEDLRDVSLAAHLSSGSFSTENSK